MRETRAQAGGTNKPENKDKISVRAIRTNITEYQRQTDKGCLKETRVGQTTKKKMTINT